MPNFFELRTAVNAECDFLYILSVHAHPFFLYFVTFRPQCDKALYSR